MNHFWHQWTILVVTALATAIAYYYGFVQYIWSVDVTYLATVIFGLFVFSSIGIAIVTYRKKATEMVKTQLEFIASHLTAVGMTGTVIGLMVIIADGIPEPSQLLIGVGTALTTTLAGLVCTIILNQQLTIMDQALKCGE